VTASALSFALAVNGHKRIDAQSRAANPRNTRIVAGLGGE
jgi:hypothetical protein